MDMNSNKINIFAESIKASIKTFLVEENHINATANSIDDFVKYLQEQHSHLSKFKSVEYSILEFIETYDFEKRNSFDIVKHCCETLPIIEERIAQMSQMRKSVHKRPDRHGLKDSVNNCENFTKYCFEDMTMGDTDKAIDESSALIQRLQQVIDAFQKEDDLKNKIRNLIILTIVLAILGFFIFYNFFRPRQIDNAAPRYYIFASSVVLRSSKISGDDFNKIGSLPYGTELITYDFGHEWSEVKVNSINADGEKIKGYIASQFILEKGDFFLLNSIFGDTDSKTIIETSKCRRALLNYFKGQGYIGRISLEEANELGLPIPTTDNQWQVYCFPKDVQTNNVYFKRILRKDSKFTDFAVIIKNINTGERKLLFFYFDDDETSHLATEQSAPEYGTIKKIYLKIVNNEQCLMVDYTE